MTLNYSIDTFLYISSEQMPVKQEELLVQENGELDKGRVVFQLLH